MPGRTCTICSHAERGAIDVAIAAGTSYRDISLRFGPGIMAVQRHASSHLPASVVQAQEAREEAQALDVVKQLKAINGAALAILTAARKGNKHDLALKAIDRIQRQIELQAKLLGDLADAPQVNVLLSAEWVVTRGAIMQALAPHPDARHAVVTALKRVDAMEQGEADHAEHVG